MNTLISTKNNDKYPASVRLVGNLLIALILVLIVELSAFVVMRFIIAPKNATLVYTPPFIDPVIYNDYLDYRHPVLGWSTAITEKRKYSATKESRPNTIFPDTDSSCVSVYGDSFTFGSDVTDDEAWANVLSELMNCKVANFGLGGYGQDQAYIRYSLNEPDTAKVNILGIYPYDILRNLNQYRPFLAGRYASFVGLKPRFIIEDDELTLIPPPEYDHAEIVAHSESPSTDQFPHETFLPGSKYGPPVLEFPYSLVALRFIASPAMRNIVLRRPSWAQFMDRDHPTNALQIAIKINDKFAALAKKRGHRSLVLVFPTASSYRYYKRTGEVITQPLLDSLAASNIDHVYVHQKIADYLGERDYCEILTRTENCSGHYNAEGNRLIAAIVKARIDELPAALQ